MGKIILFSSLQKREKELQDTLIETAKKIRTKAKTQEKNIIAITDLKFFFQKIINEELFKLKEITFQAFVCSTHISLILSEFSLFESLETFYLIDEYINLTKKESSLAIIKNADLCFIVYSLFPGKRKRFFGDMKFYLDSGTALYYFYYQTTGKEIGYYMGQKFSFMANIVSKKFKESL